MRGAKVVALVPMRHTSERVPGKNYREFAGRPLYHRVVETLLACSSIRSVVIDTDSPMIREDSARTFPEVTVLERAPHLTSGNIPMNEVILDDVRRVPAPVYLQTHSTSPLLRRETVERAVEAFFDGLDTYDSLFSVTRRQARFWTPDGRAVNHDPDVLLRTQDLSPLMEENSCLYIFSAETLIARRNRIGYRPMLFEMDPLEAWDIDEESDFSVAEILYRMRQGRADSSPGLLGDAPGL